MKTNAKSTIWVAILVGVLLIILATIVTSAVPKIETTIPTSTTSTASIASPPEEEAFVDSTGEPPYSAILEEFANSGPGILL